MKPIFINLGKYTFDAHHSLLRNDETEDKTTITAMETQILQILVENLNDIVKREVILNRCWKVKHKDYFASRSLDVFVNKLRNILKDDDHIKLKTIRGIGLSLVINN